MERYFLGNNTGLGFFGYYKDELAKKDRVFLLKGGPGTGKSTLMRQIARECFLRGFDYEEWYCSGDPSSLDGIFVKEKNLCVVDATAPHASEADLPIVRDEIVNLAEALDRDVLLENRKEIEIAINDKKLHFTHANRHLKYALCYYNDIMECEQRGVKSSDIIHFALNWHYNLHKSSGKDMTATNLPYKRKVFFEAITPDGENKFYDYLRGKEIYLVVGNLATKKVFFDALASLLQTGVFLYNPLQPSDIVGIIFGGKAIVTDVGYYENSVSERIDLSIFEGQFDDTLAKELGENILAEVEKAKVELNLARDSHLQIEKYYISAMDFEKLAKIKSDALAKIF
ncbi:MAG: hypothetical protein RR338_02495 [Clostridia bacterium]